LQSHVFQRFTDIEKRLEEMDLRSEQLAEEIKETVRAAPHHERGLT